MLIDLATAKAHLYVDGTADDAIITLYIEAAESSVSRYAGRNIYATQNALDAAVAAVPGEIGDAVTAYDAAILAADALDAGPVKDAAIESAESALSAVQQAGRMAYHGMVINSQIKAAILLVVGHLYANREDTVTGTQVAQLPKGSEYLIDPFQVY